MQEPLLEASKLAVETLRAGNKILLCEMVEVQLMHNILQQNLQEDTKQKEEDFLELLLQLIQVH